MGANNKVLSEGGYITSEMRRIINKEGFLLNKILKMKKRV